MAQRTGITREMLDADPNAQPQPQVAEKVAEKPVMSQADADYQQEVDDYVNPTVSRKRRSTQAVIKPELEDDEEKEESFVFFVPPKQEAVSYVVETVLDSKLVGKKVLYQVKWEGFDDEEDNTWEPEKHLDDCWEKLEKYWKASPESVGAKHREVEVEKAKKKRRKSEGPPPPPFSDIEAGLNSMSKEKLLQVISTAWEFDGDLRWPLAKLADVMPPDEAPADENDGWGDAEDQELMLSWNWRASIASANPPLSKTDASKYKIDISDGTLKIGTGGAPKEVLLPEPMAVGKVYAVVGGEAQPTEAAFPLAEGREEKGLQFDLETESWRLTFERAKPNAMRLRIEVFPKNGTAAKQVLYAFPDPKT